MSTPASACAGAVAASYPASATKPWLRWPAELPTAGHCQCTPEFKTLFDEKRVREMHQDIRARVFAQSKKPASADGRGGLGAGPHSVILLAGGTDEKFAFYDSDTSVCDFRQEAFFRYVFGVNEPDCFGALDLDSGESWLFVPRQTEDSQRWNGTIRPLEYHTQRYGVTTTFYTEDLHKTLKAKGVQTLYTLYGQNLDSGSFTVTEPKFDGIADFKQNKDLLHNMLVELRVRKTPMEIEVLRISQFISSQAHVYVMRHIRPGMCELQLEALYKSWCAFFGGTRHCAYTCICGSGENGSILHYGHAGRPNERILQEGDSCVLDMGAEFQGYATDITRSYPVNGKYTADQRMVHTAVYEAQKAVIAALRPGVHYHAMHQLAERIIVTHLRDAGVLHNGTVDEMLAAHMGAVFMPHGLGHLIGYHVHDVGGRLPGEKKSSVPGLSYLRLGRELEAGMYLTVEPGLYFNDPTLDKALRNPDQARFINAAVLARFRGTGGCRLEDDVLVTPTGAENLTALPTSPDEIEELMATARK